MTSSHDTLLNAPPPQAEQRPPAFASRILLGGPVVLVTTTWRGKQNVMPLAWHSPLSSDPPLVGIAIEQSRHTAEMISHAEEFALNVPMRPLLHHVQYLGAMTGEEIDKLDATQMETFAPTHISAPLLHGCAAWVECEVQEVLPLGDHVLFVGLVVATRVDPASFDDRWLFGDEETRPLHFLGGNAYSSLDRLIEARVPRDFEAPERVLRERLEEELELSRDARERREQQVGELEREVERGNVVDVADVELGGDGALDLASGVALPDPEPPDSP